MRWFFLILLVINVALFAWFQQEQLQRDRLAGRAELSGVDVAPLRLLSELPISLHKRQSGQTEAAQGAGSPEPVSPPQPPAPKPVTATTDATDATETAEATGTTDATGASEPAEPAPPAPRIKSAESMAPAEPVESAESAAPGSAATQQPVTELQPLLPPTAGSLQCFHVGEFKTEALAQQFQRRLPDGVQAQLLTRPSGGVDYWVYVKSPADLQQRQSLQRQLQDGGLEVFVIQRGELAGALSLGVYRNQDLAMALYSALRRQDYDAEIFETTTSSEVYSLDIKAPEAMSKDHSWLQTLVAMRPGLKSEKKVCQGVASKQVPE